MTQAERIRDYIEMHGSISPMEAFMELGITKLATRISEMRRQGIDFDQQEDSSRNRFGERVTYMRYYKKGALHE